MVSSTRKMLTMMRSPLMLVGKPVRVLITRGRNVTQNCHKCWLCLRNGEVESSINIFDVGIYHMYIYVSICIYIFKRNDHQYESTFTISARRNAYKLNRIYFMNAYVHHYYRVLHSRTGNACNQDVPFRCQDFPILNDSLKCDKGAEGFLSVWILLYWSKVLY